MGEVGEVAGAGLVAGLCQGDLDGAGGQAEVLAGGGDGASARDVGQGRVLAFGQDDPSVAGRAGLVLDRTRARELVHRGSSRFVRAGQYGVVSRTSGTPWRR
ncbi:hypothetical protein ACFQ6N_17545 [Kitasatospora sp. NPDC056446]|uniref:hypothetical protein n=1 Tax=Kitasatospora sp. NPDC056446 TaxID=3345819 RepID=UPI0036BF3D56